MVTFCTNFEVGDSAISLLSGHILSILLRSFHVALPYNLLTRA